MPILRDIAALFVPRVCPVCGRKLADADRELCLPCLDDVPLTFDWLEPFNPLEEMLLTQTSVVSAASLYQYDKHEAYKNIALDIKFNNRRRLGVYMGEWLGKFLVDSQRFDTIDLVVPLPLHKRREQSRGYNQSERIAQGVARAMNLPLETTAVKRVVATSPQSHLPHLEERRENVRQAFAVVNPHLLEKKQILLVDDIITTGSTVAACVNAIRAAVPSCRVSVASLASVAAPQG